MQNILSGKEDITDVLEKAKKQALSSVMAYNDKSNAKLKNELYDLDVFLSHHNQKEIRFQKAKDFSKNGYNQREVWKLVNQDLRTLLDDLDQDIDRLHKSKSAPEIVHKVNKVKDFKPIAKNQRISANLKLLTKKSTSIPKNLAKLLDIDEENPPDTPFWNRTSLFDINNNLSKLIKKYNGKNSELDGKKY